MDLHRMRTLINRYPCACFAVERAMSRATRCTPMLTGMPRGGAKQPVVEAGVELLELAKNKRDEIASELADMRSELAPMIDALDTPLAREAMRMRYLEGMSAREIACRLNYSEVWIFKVLRRAETAVEKEYS
ncbi:MAG: DUF1492 domain-containing protein [Clostridiales bacterium]|nr:DUF1492 domain-containing protein [Clostridiales bacterium]